MARTFTLRARITAMLPDDECQAPGPGPQRKLMRRVFDVTEITYQGDTDLRPLVAYEAVLPSTPPIARNYHGVGCTPAEAIVAHIETLIASQHEMAQVI